VFFKSHRRTCLSAFRERVPTAARRLFDRRSKGNLGALIVGVESTNVAASIFDAFGGCFGHNELKTFGFVVKFFGNERKEMEAWRKFSDA
jgi:hypothetical protein